MSTTRTLTHRSSLLLFLGGLIGIQYCWTRGDWTDDFGVSQQLPFYGVYALLFLLYFLLLHLTREEKEIQWTAYASLIFRVSLIFALPNLSDDFYRFAWDGTIALDGQGLLNYIPEDFLTEIPPGDSRPFLQSLYPHLNSQAYYTVYPPSLQAVFRGAAWLAGYNLLGMVIVMKTTIVLAELGTLWLLKKLLDHFEKPRHWLLVYALNPLVIIETVGNVHFEAFMLFFSLLALWIMIKAGTSQRYLWASIPIALAICSKLLPVLFFPFLVRRLGWVKAIVLGLLSAALTVGFFALVFNLTLFDHFLESIRLYFQSFEFNGNVYYVMRFLLGEKGYWANRILPYVAMGFILALAWRSKDKSWAKLPLLLLLALTAYQLLAPVIHPWYITPLVGFAVLSRYRFPVVWSIFLPLTYLTYANPDYQEVYWVLWVEYAILFVYIFFEWQFRAGEKTLEDWVREKPYLKKILKQSIPARMKIKLDRIAAYIPSDHQVLDIGTGNGGLCRELRGRGYEVQPVDVKNISFFEDVTPMIYDGRKLPFEAGSFPTTMLITVLHHIPDPESVLDEAIRASSNRIIVMEDIYKNPLQKYLTYFTDSLVNLEFAGHPHTNKDDAGWLQAFEDRGLKLVTREEFRTLVFFRQVIYVLEK